MTRAVDTAGQPAGRLLRLCIGLCMLAGLLHQLPAQARVDLPPTPAWSVVQPISLAGTGSESLSFDGALFRIPMGTKIGAIYRFGRDEPLQELRWDKPAGLSREFNVAVNDRLKEFGYSVVDLSDRLFANTDPQKARFKLAALVTTLETNYYTKTKYYETSPESYGVATLDLELQVQDSDSQKVVFTGKYRGYGIEQSKTPQPLYKAFVNAVDHALADPGFVAVLRKGAADAAGAGGTQSLLAIAHCDHDSAAHLPGVLGTLTQAVVGLRSGTILGSGVIISTDGYVLTAAHVVEGRETAIVSLSGGLSLDARVVRIDIATDVALLKLPGRGFQCAPFAPEPAAVGTDLFAVGTPLNPKLANSITRGIVSGIRTIDNHRLIQTDASVSPGNSGGPLFDANGRIQALVQFKEAGTAIEGIAFGVPVSAIVSSLALTLN